MTIDAHPGSIRLWGAPSSPDEPWVEYRAPEGRLVADPWSLATIVFEPGHAREWPGEVHHEHELVWCEGGPLDVETQGRRWLVPPTLGIWLPARTPHKVRADPDVTVYATYLNPDQAVPRWDSVVGVPVTPLLRELLLHGRTAVMPDASRHNLQALAVEQIVPLPAASIELRMPRDVDLRHVTERLLATPGDGRSLDAWASEIGTSPRTFMRRFVEETGLSFAQWRILARTGAALVLLAGGRPVREVAREVGYSSPSTFVSVFRRTTGMSPAAYARLLGAPGH
ncbi:MULTISPECIES: helix-turn-helix domain-containing protein [Oerskovia]|uniref:Helix-turn-helix transcriptional regulator n=1 Tax=Oerskovia gallyi TaxID=2762226 RepID=A0ABR8UYG9_9CELL|nr:AraC family transcriptional regulator [Oerskovia gallyi]MBD7997281.1 helix-turn-helix transcriptional regulator [Oerskovia gallyi]